MTPVDVDAAYADRLDAFLARRGSTRDQVLTTIVQAFGTPLLVVAAGSILHGFGNERSDVDLNVVVDREVTRLPITTYVHDVMIDAKYFAPHEVERWVTMLREEPWPQRGRVDRGQWSAHLAGVINCIRFGHGVVLAADASWNAWAARLRASWLVTAVERWWTVESIRRQLGARWLAASNPMLAAQRQFEAVLAAFEGRAAAAGQLHYGAKWIAAKLRRIGDHAALDALQAAMRAPTTEREANAYVARCDAIIDEFRPAAPRNLTAQLWYLPGVEQRALDARALVSRWRLRSLEIRGSVPPPTNAEPIWEGALDAPLPAAITALFSADMTWLSIAQAA